MILQRIEREKLAYLLILIGAWTAFGLFFGTQSYIRAAYAGRPASLPGYLISWIVCGYSWGVLTFPLVRFIRKYSLRRLNWPAFLLIHIPASAVFACVQLLIYLAIAGVLFHAAGSGVIEFYKFLLANELQTSILVYFALVSIVTVKDIFFARRSIQPATSGNGSSKPANGTIETAENGHTNGYVRRLSVKDNGRIVLVDTNKIHWIESYGNYLFLHTPDRKFIYRETMANMEKRLDPSEFVRIRRSAIVKVDQIRELHPIENGEFEIVIAGGQVLCSTRRYRKNLEIALNA